MLEVHVQMELKRHLVEHLVQLLSCGHVLEVKCMCVCVSITQTCRLLVYTYIAGSELHAQVYEDREPGPFIH